MTDRKAEHAKWDGFDKKGEPSTEELVGSGISETSRHMWQPNFVAERKWADEREPLTELQIELPTPWSENRV